MSRARLIRFFLVRLLPLLVLGLLGERALAQADPPSRVARLNYLEGAAVFAPVGDNEWTDAVLNRPLTRGDRVWTDKGSRAELQVGSSAVRMDGQAHLEILALDDRSAQLSVTQGTVYVRVRSLPEGENFEIDTPNLAYRAAYPGDYRIDVNANTGTTRVTIHSGTGAVYGEDGQVLTLGGGQQITFRSRDLSQMAAQESPPQDNFDRWAAERNRREDQSVSARYVPREVVGYQQLDAHGQWMQDATHGPVWFPQGLAANWAPYRNGHWEWIAPWGWTWIDAAVWGFAPFHYGRWATIDSRWAWVPGRLALKPVYSPALVAFIGGSNGAVNWSLAGGRPGVAWFPLAPGEAWQPAYTASAAYMSNVNGNATVEANATYAHQRKPEALTSISAEDFHRGQPVRASWLRVAANTLTNAPIVPPPPMPERRVAAERKPAAVARALPPPAKVQVAAAPASSIQEPLQTEASEPPARKSKAGKAAMPANPEPSKVAAATQKTAPAVVPPQVPALAAAASSPLSSSTARGRPAEQAKLAQSRRQEQRLAEEAKAEQAKAEEEKLARRAEQARREQLAKRSEQAKREQIARQIEQSRREQQLAKQAEQTRRDQQLARQAEQARRELQLARQAEQARREQQLARQAEAAKRELAKREQARRDLIARKAEQARREEQARQVEQARREALARRDEQQRREAHARQVEQAKRAADREAQALREQREEREELQARREAQERELARQQELAAQRAAWQRQQQAIGEQWRRDHQTWEQQQRARQRPELRDDRGDRRARPPEPQRGIPIIAGPWS